MSRNQIRRLLHGVKYNETLDGTIEEYKIRKEKLGISENNE